MAVIDGRDGRDGEDYDSIRDVINDHVNGQDDHTDHSDHYGADDEREFELTDEDESLPWLDSDYDDEDEDGVDALRIVGFVLLALLALGLFLGLLYWLTNSSPDPELVADGSTIEAPEGPIKAKPEDAGGREFEGTGNVAPKVGEGETSEGQMADGNTPRPSVDVEGSRNTGGSGSGDQGSSSNAEAASGSAGSGAASASGGTGVQVGAYTNRNGAVVGWKKLNSQSTALNGFKYRVVEATVDGSKVFRLQAVTTDAAAARKLCDALKADGLPCQVKR